MKFDLKFDHTESTFPEAMGLQFEESKEIDQFVAELVMDNHVVSQNIEAIVEKYGHSLVRLLYAVHSYGVMRGILKTAVDQDPLKSFFGLLKFIKDLQRETGHTERKDLN